MNEKGGHPGSWLLPEATLSPQPYRFRKQTPVAIAVSHKQAIFQAPDAQSMARYDSWNQEPQI